LPETRTAFSLAGFQVTTIGRFWVTAEELLNPIPFHFDPKLFKAPTLGIHG
jgi:hypothetical protein